MAQIRAIRIGLELPNPRALDFKFTLTTRKCLVKSFHKSLILKYWSKCRLKLSQNINL